MRKTVYGLIVVLAVLHQDWWGWDDSDTLVFGFLPIGLFFHAVISLSAGGLWWLAVVFCWPGELEDSDSSDEMTTPTRGGPA